MRISDWSSDVCSSDLIERVGLYFTVELIRSLGLIADSLRRGDDARLARAMDKLQALEGMAMRILSDDASLIISLLYQVAESYARSAEHTSELQSLMRISYAVFCLKKKNTMR